MKFLELDYYTEVSNLTSVYMNFPSKYLPWAVTHFCQCHKALGSIPGNLFSTSVCALITIAVAYQLSQIVLSEEFLVLETGKSGAVTSAGCMADAPKPPHCAWQGTFSLPTTSVLVCCCAEEAGSGVTRDE
jgi:hypothetical protein